MLNQLWLWLAIYLPVFFGRGDGVPVGTTRVVVDNVVTTGGAEVEVVDGCTVPFGSDCSNDDWTSKMSSNNNSGFLGFAAMLFMELRESWVTRTCYLIIKYEQN